MTAAMEPIAGYPRGHNPAGGRDSAPATGYAICVTTANKTPGYRAHAVAVHGCAGGHRVGDEPRTASGAAIYGSIAVGHLLATMDGALKGTSSLSQTDEVGAGGAAAATGGGTTFGRPSSSPRSKLRRDYHPDRSPTITLAPPPPAPPAATSRRRRDRRPSSNISPLPLAADLRSR